MNIPSILQQQRAYFKTQQTKDVSFIISVLKKLKQEIVKREQDIYDALKKDFNKSAFESFMSEYGIVISEINLVLNHSDTCSEIRTRDKLNLK